MIKPLKIIFHKLISIFTNSNNNNNSPQLQSNNSLHDWFQNLRKIYYSKFVFISFFLLGYCNLFPIITMISAAHDLLKTHPIRPEHVVTKRYINKYDCNEISTGKYLTLCLCLISNEPNLT